MLAAFLLYLRRFFEPMQELSSSTTRSSQRRPRWRSCRACSTRSRPSPSPSTRAAAARTRERRPSTTCAFGYRDAVVLPDLDLHIPAGQTVALVGATGAGKTTIARLVARFYDPPEARCGSTASTCATCPRPTCGARSSWSPRRTSCSPARSPTTSGSAGRARPRPSVNAAAQAIGAHDFIAALPDGYDTDVTQARRPAVGRAAAARRLRPRVPRRSGGAHPRRGDLVARHPVGAAGAAGAAHAPRRPHGADHRPPAVHRRDRRPGARARRRAASSRTARPPTGRAAAATPGCTKPGQTHSAEGRGAACGVAPASSPTSSSGGGQNNDAMPAAASSHRVRPRSSTAARAG